MRLNSKLLVSPKKINEREVKENQKGNATCIISIFHKSNF